MNHQVRVPVAVTLMVRKDRAMTRPTALATSLLALMPDGFDEMELALPGAEAWSFDNPEGQP